MRRIPKHLLLWTSGVLTVCAGLLLPSRINAFQPERSYFGPFNYDSSVNQPLEISLFSGARSMPAVFSLDADFQVDKLPESDSSHILSTGVDGQGLSLDVDFLGTLYLRLKSSPPDSARKQDGSQLVKASDRFDLGKQMRIRMSYRRETSQFSVEVNGESKVLFETEDLDQTFDAARILPDLSFVQIGGRGPSFLAGSVSNVRLSVSDTDERGRTQEVGLILIILGVWMILAGQLRYLAGRKSTASTSVD